MNVLWLPLLDRARLRVSLEDSGLVNPRVTADEAAALHRHALPGSGRALVAIVSDRDRRRACRPARGEHDGGTSGRCTQREELWASYPT
jgi:hypothetical protein